MRWLFVLFPLALAPATGCASPGTGAVPPAPPDSRARAAGATDELLGEASTTSVRTRADSDKAGSAAPDSPPPAPEPARFEVLSVPDFLEAVVSLPPGNLREPVLVATHGAGGAPEHHCSAWREHLGARGIVLCPRGAMMDKRYGAAGGFYYPDHHALERELAATLQSFESHYAGRMIDQRYVYAGYSQGATMGALVLPRHADKFPRAILVEGGFNEWDLRGARLFKKNGGVRVAFVCGGRGCKRGADRSAAILRRADVEVVSKLAEGAGHTYLGPVARQIASTFPWLVEGNETWDTKEREPSAPTSHELGH